MRLATSRLALLVAALSGAALLVATVTADAATKKKRTADASSRDAAISQCVARAQQETPLMAPEATSRRLQLYKDCMARAGFRP